MALRGALTLLALALICGALNAAETVYTRAHADPVVNAANIEVEARQDDYSIILSNQLNERDAEKYKALDAARRRALKELAKAMFKRDELLLAKVRELIAKENEP